GGSPTRPGIEKDRQRIREPSCDTPQSSPGLRGSTLETAIPTQYYMARGIKISMPTILRLAGCFISSERRPSRTTPKAQSLVAANPQLKKWLGTVNTYFRTAENHARGHRPLDTIKLIREELER